MTAHDPACPMPTAPTRNCLYCRTLATARSQERATAAETWQANLPLIEHRVARDERAAVERRVRESGVARWLPSHQWETLITAIRGPQ